MAEIKQTERAEQVLVGAMQCSKDYRHEFIMPEHLLLKLFENYHFRVSLSAYCPPLTLASRVERQLEQVERVPEDIDYEPTPSEQMGLLIELACRQVVSSSAEAIDVPHLTQALLQLEDSWACYLLKDALRDQQPAFLSQLIGFCEYEDQLASCEVEDNDAGQPREDAWRQFVTCMNDHYRQHNPLIGRESELQRTIQVLCRRDKNNPLHVGEPGVGKTAIVWGLAQMISEGRVPGRLLGSKVYQLDMGTLLAGTQYRGDFENRIKMIMDGIAAEQDHPAGPVANIVYIDEIHTLVGAGATGDSAMDASNLLKPYLESGTIRFIGSTTYEEYNRHFARSKGLIRRFQQIDIGEPSIDETKNIIRQLQPLYEAFHGVSYTDEALDFAVEASARHISDRFLPDKAIDLIDEAGAAMESEKGKVKREEYAIAHSTLITKAHIADVLAKTCKVDALALASDEDNSRLESLPKRMLDQIYGQDQAVSQVIEAVQMSRAGLTDEGKPMAALLFVGPTGVGKTEVARVLARELGIELVRFDMSEYTEKHTVAKLIGSPAGYVGYEDGGLLTDAIRRTPNCVLLLDEIEKAHQDIYNILLQVMDYARLTDSKGRKADFRNVVVIMTSNAGAQFASQASVGFNGGVSRGEAMLQQVKKTFKPEFRNRLSGTVVFRDMDRPMATLILRKKLRELGSRLAARQVTMTLTDEAFDHLLQLGFTPEYGAREMDRVIGQQLKPLLMREMLFGRLKNGGKAEVTLSDGGLSLR